MFIRLLLICVVLLERVGVVRPPEWPGGTVGLRLLGRVRRARGRRALARAAGHDKLHKRGTSLASLRLRCRKASTAGSGGTMRLSGIIWTALELRSSSPLSGHLATLLPQHGVLANCLNLLSCWRKSGDRSTANERFAARRCREKPVAVRDCKGIAPKHDKGGERCLERRCERKLPSRCVEADNATEMQGCPG